MAVLRYQSDAGEQIEVMLDLFKRQYDKPLPLSIGSAPESENHIHLSDHKLKPQHAIILGSIVSPSFVLRGQDVRIHGRSLEGIRVLRHGDRIQLGNSELLYLDFNIYQLKEGSKFIGLKCAKPDCSELFSIADPDAGLFSGKTLNSELISCPWSQQVYHARCWFRLEQCVKQSCYPIRRMLLSELSPQVKLETMTGSTLLSEMKCAGRCDAGTIELDREIIRCHNSDCRAPYHPECWFAMRRQCLVCGADIPGLIEKHVFYKESRSH